MSQSILRLRVVFIVTAVSLVLMGMYGAQQRLERTSDHIRQMSRIKASLHTRAFWKAREKAFRKQVSVGGEEGKKERRNESDMSFGDMLGLPGWALWWEDNDSIDSVDSVWSPSWGRHAENHTSKAAASARVSSAANHTSEQGNSHTSMDASMHKATSLHHARVIRSVSTPTQVLLTVGGSYLEVFVNWWGIYHRQLKRTRTDVNFVVLCYDDVSMHAVTWLGLSCTRMHTAHDDPHTIWWTRFLQVRKLIDAGYDVILTDSDALWIGDPITIFDVLHTDIVSSYGKVFGHPCFCMGWIGLRATSYTRVLVKNVIGDGVKMRDDQKAVNEEMRACDAKELGVYRDHVSSSRDVAEGAGGLQVYEEAAVSNADKGAALQQSHKPGAALQLEQIDIARNDSVFGTFGGVEGCEGTQAGKHDDSETSHDQMRKETQGARLEQAQGGREQTQEERHAALHGKGRKGTYARVPLRLFQRHCDDMAQARKHAVVMHCVAPEASQEALKKHEQMVKHNLWVLREDALRILAHVWLHNDAVHEGGSSMPVNHIREWGGEVVGADKAYVNNLIHIARVSREAAGLGSGSGNAERYLTSSRDSLTSSRDSLTSLTSATLKGEGVQSSGGDGYVARQGTWVGDMCTDCNMVGKISVEGVQRLIDRDKWNMFEKDWGRDIEKEGEWGGRR